MTGNSKAPRNVIFNADCIDARCQRHKHKQAYLLTKGEPAMPPHLVSDMIGFP